MTLLIKNGTHLSFPRKDPATGGVIAVVGEANESLLSGEWECVVVRRPLERPPDDDGQS